MRARPHQQRAQRVVVSVMCGLMAFAGFGILSASAQNEDKTTICHRTNSDNNPYVVNTPANEGVLNGHFEQHKGPIWEPGLKDQGIEWGDIIPPFPGHPEGLNWTTEGMAIFNNDCVPPNLPPPTTAPPETAPPTTAGPPPPGPAAAPPAPAAPAAGRAPAAAPGVAGAAAAVPTQPRTAG